jgi:hypothetical protein
MRTVLLMLLTIVATQFGTKASANISIFQGTLKPSPKYSECVKAIEKGVVISIKENGRHVFFYKDKLYSIGGNGATMVCMVGENFKKK